jgi:hypothetical protein
VAAHSHSNITRAACRTSGYAAPLIRQQTFRRFFNSGVSAPSSPLLIAG